MLPPGHPLRQATSRDAGFSAIFMSQLRRMNPTLHTRDTAGQYVSDKVGRNEPCPGGCSKKWKRCEATCSEPELSPAPVEQE